MFEINEWLEWLESEIQHVSIFINLQAMTCMRKWLKYKGGSSSEFIFLTKIPLAQRQA